MNTGFYPRLAWTGMRKNKRMYTPYLLTCIGMVMMLYIISSLSVSPLLSHMSGGNILKAMLSFGKGVIGLFALIFLFYTNSFLVRRRKKEFGLYNILGMGKANLARVLAWETLIIAGFSLAIGLLCGIALSKLAELGLVNILQGSITYSLSVSLSSILQTVIVFAIIYLLIFLNTLRQVHAANPVALLHSENTGEKPPKGNWLLGVLGILLLGGAYYLAVTIRDPVSALAWFFIAVLMVIVGTYMLFIAGSVLFCRLLQKNKKYYYQSRHFVSVSSMVYRMKRNGAGLASICILGTMVLVILSSTSCLYIGAEDSLRTLYPRNIIATVNLTDKTGLETSFIDGFRQSFSSLIEKAGVTPFNQMDYRSATFSGYLKDGVLEPDITKADLISTSLSGITQVSFIPLEDYNHIMNTHEVLNSREVLIFSKRMTYHEQDLIVNGGGAFHIKKVLNTFMESNRAAASIVPSLYVVVSDFADTIDPLMSLSDFQGDRMLNLTWNYGFDLNANKDLQLQLREDMSAVLGKTNNENEQKIEYYSCDCATAERDDFYATYGGLFFLGIMLSIVFIFAAVLIIYYKQISEGYEDQSRFSIMQNIGMTKCDIRKSINSQMLTVFFLPLITAGVHLAFAFPLVQKLLMLFNLTNTPLLILVTLGSYLLFALFYVLVYRATSNAYYSIVSSARADD